MAYQFPPDVEKLVQHYMTSGAYESQDALLRDALKALEVQQKTIVYDDPKVIEGIARGLDEMNRGLGRPFEEFDAEFRDQRNHLSND